MAGITLDQTAIERVSYPKGAPAPVRFAAEELQSYLKESLGVAIDAGEGAPSKGSFFISTTEVSPKLTAEVGPFEEGKYDRCIIAGRNGRILMIGENPISALYAVYDFLQEKLNIRFFGPGHEHEYIPKRSELHLEEGYFLQTGSLLAIREYVTLSLDTMTFAVKNRGNSMLAAGRSVDDLDGFRTLGVKLKGPGHIWRDLIPDESLFREHPEFFPMIDGKRTVNNRTACFSNPEVRKIFSNNLRKHIKQNPYWDIFAFYAEDIHDPYYCGCPECSKMDIPDWYVTLGNDAAKVLEEECPHSVFELIAYHGTRIAPKQVKKLYRNGNNMQFFFCIGYTRDIFNPFEKKTYGSAEVFEMYKNWRKYLSEVEFEGRLMLADYYVLSEQPNQGPRGRALLWPMEVILEDFRFYLKEGIAGLSDFIIFDRLCWPSPFNVWCWFQLWKNPETTIETLKDDFYPKYFGKTGVLVREYIDKLEAAMHERTSPDNIERVKDLVRILDSIESPEGDEQLAQRLKLVRIHHEYCVLLKEIFQAFIDDNPARWQALEKPYVTFFETHRSDLEGHIDPIPPHWADTWYTWAVKRGTHLEMAKNEMLH